MRRLIPVMALFLLAPFVAEVLFGATPVSSLGRLVPVLPLYGGGAVLIRELARRRGSGWGRLALLGAVYAIVEEGLLLQSMFNPALFNAAAYGGRALGVNWVYTEWTIGYHIVYTILIPVLLAELLFPDRRAAPWLGAIGVAVAGVLYALGALVLGVVTRLFLSPNFTPALVLTIVAALLVVVLVALALRAPVVPTQPAQTTTAGDVPSPWLVGAVAFLAALIWFGLLDLPAALRTSILVVVPMILALAVALGVAALLRRWSAVGERWTDLHRLALACGTLPVVMLAGFFGVTASNPIDQLGQGVISVVVIVLLALFAWRLRQRERGMVKSVLA
jgi:hypothetical protein